MEIFGYLYLEFISFLLIHPGSIPVATGLVRLGNARQDGNDTVSHIGWYDAVVVDLDIIHPD